MRIKCATRLNRVKPVYGPPTIYSAHALGDIKCMGRPKKHREPIHQKTMLYLWRTMNGYSQGDVAAGLRHPVSQSTIGRLEDGLHPYNQELLEDIAEFLGITILELMHINPLDIAGSTRNLIATSPRLREGIGQVAAESLATYTTEPASKPKSTNPG